MATSKTLTPTNVTIQIPEFTDQPDQRVNSNCIDKEADAINALNGNIVTKVNLGTAFNATSVSTIESNFSTYASEMSDSGIKTGYIYPNISGWGGAPAFYMLSRKDSSTYSAIIISANIIRSGYYYSNSWHWYSLSMNAV